MKVMSIIGIVWFTLSFLIIIALLGDNDNEAAAGWGILALMYALPYSITGVVLSSKNSNAQRNTNAELLQLAELKEKGILTEAEFQAKKAQLL